MSYPLDPEGLPDPVKTLEEIIALRGWEAREAQKLMVAQVNDGISRADRGFGSDADVSVSAPVGSGKSVGELMAPLVRGKRFIVATSTKRLQAQMMTEELRSESVV